MTEHTPTPWAIAEIKTSVGRCFKIGSDEMLNEAGKPTYVCVYDDYGHGDNVQRANANFIIQAVNNHDALVDALISVRAEINLQKAPMLAAKIDAALDAVGREQQP